MTNLTFDEKLIREHKAEPLEGHTVVVLERVGDEGERFHSLLEPGDERPRRDPISFLLRRPNLYFAYAVDASKSRLLAFKEQVEMAERPHEFELQFSLWYRAADPQLLVSVRESDPLERVRKKVAEVVVEEMAELPWAEVWHSFRTAGEDVVSSTLAELKGFARDYGIAITSLKLRAKYPASATETDRKIHEAREKGRLGRERLTVAQGLKIHQSELRRDNAAREDGDRAAAARRELEDTIARETTGKVGELIHGAGTMAELEEVYASIGGSLGAGGPLGIAPRSMQTALGPGNGHPAPALPAGGDGLAAVLSDLVSLTQQFGPDGKCRHVRAIFLHLVAAMMDDDSLQVSAAQAEYARQARAEIIAAAHLPASRTEALQNLADPVKLRARLYP